MIINNKKIREKIIIIIIIIMVIPPTPTFDANSTRNIYFLLCILLVDNTHRFKRNGHVKPTDPNWLKFSKNQRYCLALFFVYKIVFSKIRMENSFT